MFCCTPVCDVRHIERAGTQKCHFRRIIGVLFDAPRMMEEPFRTSQFQLMNELRTQLRSFYNFPFAEVWSLCLCQLEHFRYLLTRHFLFSCFGFSIAFGTRRFSVLIVRTNVK